MWIAGRCRGFWRLFGGYGGGRPQAQRQVRFLPTSLPPEQVEECGSDLTPGTLWFYCLSPFDYSYKPQKISPKFQGTVRMLLHNRIRDAYIHPQFVTDVMRPMSMEA